MTEEKKESLDQKATWNMTIPEKDDKTKGFELAQRQARMLASSSMVPAQFQGDKNIGNVMIAMELAERMQVSVFALMQAMYVVHGKPGLEGKFIAALVNQSANFGLLQYQIEGQGKTDKGIDRPEKCRAFAQNKSTGEIVYGPWVTWDMVCKNGWHKDKGSETSKWQVLPELMFPYRAATYFARVNCPEVLMGMMLKEEVEELPPPPPRLVMETEMLAPGVDPYKIKEAPAKEPNPEKTDDADTAPMTDSPLKPWNDKDMIQCHASKRQVLILTCRAAKCNQNDKCDDYANYQNEHEAKK